MMRLTVSGLLWVMLLAGGMVGCANLVTLPQDSMRKVAHPPNGPGTASEVREALIVAAVQRGWVVVKDDPGELGLELTVRAHQLRVDVPYTADSYTVSYVSSENLDYRVVNGVPQIHKTYLRWLRNLEQSTQRALTARGL